jgi:putative hemolysin
MVLLITLTTCFILLSGLVAMVDAAILSVSRAETEEMVIQNVWGSLQLKKITERITRSVVVVVIVTNTINVLGPILIGQTAVATYGPAAIGWMTAILALGTIVFSEIIPKSLGSHYAPHIGRVAALPVLALTYVLYPLVLLLDALSGLFRRGSRRIGTENQIRALTNLGRRAGYIEPDEGLLIHKTFILNDRTARDIMTARDEITSLRIGSTLSEAAREIFDVEFSRYPVFGESIDDFRGYVLARDVLKEMVHGHGDQTLASVLREGWTVKANRRCDDLLLQFRLRRLHLAIVRDSDNTVGIVTLEDVLEELVGEICDEKDQAF